MLGEQVVRCRAASQHAWDIRPEPLELRELFAHPMQHLPWLIIVDSNATTGLPSLNASATSLEILRHAWWQPCGGANTDIMRTSNDTSITLPSDPPITQHVTLLYSTDWYTTQLHFTRVPEDGGLGSLRCRMLRSPAEFAGRRFGRNSRSCFSWLRQRSFREQLSKACS